MQLPSEPGARAWDRAVIVIDDVSIPRMWTVILVIVVLRMVLGT